jgi:hypothetical protein
MNKLEQLQAEINKIPRKYKHLKNVALGLLGNGDLFVLRAYVVGAYAMAACLTDEEALLQPLGEVCEMLQ